MMTRKGFLLGLVTGLAVVSATSASAKNLEEHEDNGKHKGEDKGKGKDKDKGKGKDKDKGKDDGGHHGGKDDPSPSPSPAPSHVE